jgi:hypothetical protein
VTAPIPVIACSRHAASALHSGGRCPAWQPRERGSKFGTRAHRTVAVTRSHARGNLSTTGHDRDVWRSGSAVRSGARDASRRLQRSVDRRPVAARRSPDEAVRRLSPMRRSAWWRNTQSQSSGRSHSASGSGGACATRKRVSPSRRAAGHAPADACTLTARHRHRSSSSRSRSSAVLFMIASSQSARIIARRRESWPARPRPTLPVPSRTPQDAGRSVPQRVPELRWRDPRRCAGRDRRGNAESATMRSRAPQAWSRGTCRRARRRWAIRRALSATDCPCCRAGCSRRTPSCCDPPPPGTARTGARRASQPAVHRGSRRRTRRSALR